jgi:hypothetical protein
MGGIKGSQAQGQDLAGLNQSVNKEEGDIGNLSSAGNTLLSSGLGDLSGVFQSLLNYAGLSPVQTQALTSSVTQGGQSALNTFKSEEGGVANPALLMQQLMTQNQQNGDSLALQLGSETANARLGALQSAGGLASSTLGQGVGALGGALQGQQGISSLYGNAANSMGNPWGSAFSGISNTLGGYAAQNSGGGMKQ